MGTLMSEAMPQHEIPSSLEAEDAVLGAMIYDPKCIDGVLETGLSERDYYRPSNRMLHRVITDMQEQGTEIDFITIIAELKRRKILDDVGGAAHVSMLSQRTPALANAGAYAEEIIDTAQRRCILDTGLEIQRVVYEDTNQSVTNLTAQVAMIVDRSLAELKRSQNDGHTSEKLAEWASSHIMGMIPNAPRFPHYLPTLQQQTGGIAKGHLMIVGAESGVGKSSFAQGYILSVDPSARVGYFNLEMTAKQLELRLLCSMTGIELPKLNDPNTLSEQEKEACLDALNDLSQRHYHVHDALTLNGINAIQKSQKYDLIIVDHMHRFPQATDTAGVADIARSMKNLALTTDCANITLAQFNRGDVMDSGTPNVRRLRGGNSIQEEADTILLLDRERNQHGFHTPSGTVIVAKQRDGSSGYGIPVTFNASRLRYEER